jgi:hypothetical protein
MSGRMMLTRRTLLASAVGALAVAPWIKRTTVFACSRCARMPACGY